MDHAALTLELRSYDAHTHTHLHDYHQLVLPVAGELSMRVGEKESAVSSQLAAVVAAGQAHGFEAHGDNCFVVADVPAALAPELERLPAFIKLDPALAQYVSFLHQHLRSGVGGGHSERQMLLLLIQLLHERGGGVRQLDRRIEAARSYLDQHLGRPVSQAELARVAHLSTRQLGELFRRQLGMTPQQYLTERRMQRAWQLLERGDASAQQVAEAVGYRSLASFSDRFRRHFGHPPSHFRRRGK